MKAKPIPELSEYQLERFWKCVDKRDNSSCWNWIGNLNGAMNKQGVHYGIFILKKKRYLAHRVSYYLFSGKQTELLVCHHCDNPSCVNPNHLFLGTDADNIRDMINKGRFVGNPENKNQVFGETCHNSIIRERDVPAIIERYRSGESQPSIARSFSVSRVTIQKIVLRKTWRHVKLSY